MPDYFSPVNQAYILNTIVADSIFEDISNLKGTVTEQR
jgi:hypothetical protein